MKKVILLIVAIVSLFAFTGVAFAGDFVSGTRTWSSTECTHEFWTGTISKGSSIYYWGTFYVKATYIHFTPDGGQDQKLKAKPYSSTGYVMGAETTCWLNVNKPIECTSNTTQVNVKMKIKNSYYPGGPNMESNGQFFGDYY